MQLQKINVCIIEAAQVIAFCYTAYFIGSERCFGLDLPACWYFLHGCRWNCNRNCL